MAFTIETFKFLDELALNNTRDFFEANRARYETHVREPALAFIRAMARPLATVTEHFVADDRRAGGSLMRIHRDTRFGHDKTPYKTNIGIQFRHGAGKDVHAPGFYVHISPTENFVGAGMWRPEAPTLAKIRQHLVDEPARWTAVSTSKALAKAGMAPAGEALTRVPRGFAKDHEHAVDLRRTSFILSGALTADDILAKDFPARVVKRFLVATDYMRFLCDAVGVSY